LELTLTKLIDMKNFFQILALILVFSSCTEEKKPGYDFTEFQPVQPRVEPMAAETPAHISSEVFAKYFETLKKERSQIQPNPLKGITIRFDDLNTNSVKNSERTLEETLRNHQGVHINSLRLATNTTFSNAYSAELATILNKQQSTASLMNAYSKYIPENSKLLAIHNEADKTVFEFLEKGVKKLKTVKLRGGGRVAVLTGALWATYEMLGGEDEAKKYSKQKY